MKIYRVLITRLQLKEEIVSCFGIAGATALYSFVLTWLTYYFISLLNHPTALLIPIAGIIMLPFSLLLSSLTTLSNIPFFGPANFKNGRQRYYFLASALGAAITMVLLFYPPQAFQFSSANAWNFLGNIFYFLLLGTMFFLCITHYLLHFTTFKIQQKHARQVEDKKIACQFPLALCFGSGIGIIAYPALINYFPTKNLVWLISTISFTLMLIPSFTIMHPTNFQIFTAHISNATLIKIVGRNRLFVLRQLGFQGFIFGITLIALCIPFYPEGIAGQKVDFLVHLLLPYSGALLLGLLLSHFFSIFARIMAGTIMLVLLIIAILGGFFFSPGNWSFMPIDPLTALFTMAGFGSTGIFVFYKIFLSSHFTGTEVDFNSQHEILLDIFQMILQKLSMAFAWISAMGLFIVFGFVRANPTGLKVAAILAAISILMGLLLMLRLPKKMARKEPRTNSSNPENQMGFDVNVPVLITSEGNTQKKMSGLTLRMNNTGLIFSARYSHLSVGELLTFEYKLHKEGESIKCMVVWWKKANEFNDQERGVIAGVKFASLYKDERQSLIDRWHKHALRSHQAAQRDSVDTLSNAAAKCKMKIH